MNFRVESFLGFLPLKRAVLWMSWFNLIGSVIYVVRFVIYVLQAAIRSNFKVSAFYAGMLVILFICSYFNKEYIEGVYERNHKKMSAFRFVFLVEIVLGFIHFHLFFAISCLPLELYYLACIHSFFYQMKGDQAGSNASTPGTTNQIPSPDFNEKLMSKAQSV